jgi:hypothetical protein
VLLLVAVKLEVLADVVVRDQQEPAGTASWVVDGLARRRPHHVNDGLDQRARRKVLSRSALHVSGVFLQKALVGVSLHVGIERGPLLFVNEVSDQTAQLGWVLNLVLRLAEEAAIIGLSM